MKNRLIPTAATSVVLVVGAFLAFAKDEAKPETNPAGVKVRLVAKTTTYRIAKELVGFKLPEAKEGERVNYPPAPNVDIVLEILNDTDKEMHIQSLGGDAVSLQLTLRGEGAINNPFGRGSFTAEFRGSPIVRVAAHKAYEIPIKSLSYGFRMSAAAYWTKPGAYTLAASFHTQLGWTDGKDDAIQMKRVVLASEPIDIKVEGEK